MPSRHLGNWIESYLESTQHTEPPRLYREWTAVSTIAAALQRKCWLRWDQDIVWYPNPYVVLVGPPGKSRKGTAMDVGRKLLRRLSDTEGCDITLADDVMTREALVQKLASSLRYFDYDGKQHPHSSMTIWSQEVVVFLGQDNKELIGDLTDWFNCRENWTKETKTQGSDHIENSWLSLFGAITPDAIGENLSPKAVGLGLTARIIFVYEEQQGQLNPAPWLQDNNEELRDFLYRDLIDIHKNIIGPWEWSSQFGADWIEWYPSAVQDPPDLGNLLEGYTNRRPTHVMKVAQIMSAARNSEMVLKAEDLHSAIDLLKRTEKKMPRTFKAYGSSKDARLKDAVMSFIAREKTVTKTELYQQFYTEIETKGDLVSILQVLTSMDFCHIKNEFKDESGEMRGLIVFDENSNLAEQYN